MPSPIQTSSRPTSTHHPLDGRRLLQELTVPLLRCLSGVVVSQVRDEVFAEATTFGFRYDTLEGHIERGWEWFVIRKDHESGVVSFQVLADWLPRDFPNWWSWEGFARVGRHDQRRWHRRAHRRMMAFVQGASLTRPLAPRELPPRAPRWCFSIGGP